MTTLPVVAHAVDDCWNRIGLRGDRSCPELLTVVHCHNCPVFSRAGRRFLDAPSPDGYQEEWTTRLAAPIEEESSDLTGVLVFRLCDEWLGLPVGVLVEVTSPRRPHRVPHRGGILAGIVNIRGELHLCVHLEQVLGIERRKDDIVPVASKSAKPRLLVVKGGDGARWVFAADEVDQVRRLPHDAVSGVPATVGRSLASLTRGVFRLDGRAVGLLDEERLFRALRTRGTSTPTPAR